MTERQLLYTDTLIEPGEIPGWAPATIIGGPRIDAALRGDAPWPDAGKLVILDHESLLWMLQYHGPGSPWSSAQQAAGKLATMVSAARAAYPEAKLGVYGLPFLPFGKSVALDPGLAEWIGTYHAMAIVGCDLVCPSVYPTKDPRRAGQLSEATAVRLLDLAHGRNTVAAAKMVAAGRQVVPFTTRMFPPVGDGRLMAPTEYRFQAEASMEADGIVLWTTLRWWLDVACMADFPVGSANASTQARHRMLLDVELGQRHDWRGAEKAAIRNLLVAHLSAYALAAENQLAGVRAAS